MQKKYFYVANWKNYVSYHHAIMWCTHHAAELTTVAADAQIIICPDFLATAQVGKLIAPVALGAQNCSAHEMGAYTGEISAQSLKEAGVSYCIVGHSERRRLGETTEVVARKVEILLQHGIMPIVCVSDAWESELPLVLSADRKGGVSKDSSGSNLIIAYEPISAIGTGKTPPTANIAATVNLIKKQISQTAPHVHITMLYGGSVSAKNSAELKQIAILDGFLIGKASTDFQELKNIILAKP